MSSDKLNLSRAYLNGTKPAGGKNPTLEYNISICLFVCTFVPGPFAIFVIVFFPVWGSSVAMYLSPHWGPNNPSGVQLNIYVCLYVPMVTCATFWISYAWPVELK